MSHFHVFLVYFDGSADFLSPKKAELNVYNWVGLMWKQAERDKNPKQQQQLLGLHHTLRLSRSYPRMSCTFPVFKHILLSLKSDESASLKLPA